MRASVKAAIQAAFGWLPWGAHLYRHLTRRRMGTQATHVDKMARAWAGYAPAWRDLGVALDGADLWMHDGGWTVYPFLLSHLLTGRGGTVTMWEGSLEDRYTARALEFAARQRFGDLAVPAARRARVVALAGASAARVLDALGARWVTADRVEPRLPPRSVDLAVTGGTLEHLRPDELAAFLARSREILRPGGWFSHVFDLRDHLYHADKSIPFLDHLRHGERAYELRHGHALGYHNRLLPAEIRAALARAGFEVVSMRRRVLPAERYVDRPTEVPGALVGLDRARLAPRFRAATDDDLRTVALWCVGRRP